MKTFLSTLFYSWGGDTPAEAIWAGNDFLNWLEKDKNIKIINRFKEPENNTDEDVYNYDAVLEELKQLNLLTD